jgi:hypothetical protein
MSDSEISRRELARRGLFAGGAVFAAAAAPAAFGAASAFGQADSNAPDTDTEILVGLIGFEQQTILGYDTAVASGSLGDFAPTATKFVEQEREHERLLAAALAKIGGQPLPAPRADSVPGLTQAQGRDGWLTFLIASENQLVAAYIEGQKELTSADLLILSAQNCINVGQHLVALRQALGTDPLPSALPSGSEKK